MMDKFASILVQLNYILPIRGPKAQFFHIVVGPNVHDTVLGAMVLYAPNQL
jgi:hypothetical protein